MIAEIEQVDLFDIGINFIFRQCQGNIHIFGRLQHAGQEPVLNWRKPGKPIQINMGIFDLTGLLCHFGKKIQNLFCGLILSFDCFVEFAEHQTDVSEFMEQQEIPFFLCAFLHQEQLVIVHAILF